MSVVTKCSERAGTIAVSALGIAFLLTMIGCGKEPTKARERASIEEQSAPIENAPIENAPIENAPIENAMDDQTPEQAGIVEPDSKVHFENRSETRSETPTLESAMVQDNDVALEKESLPEANNPLPKIDPPPFRLLLPTEAGPLLVDVEILLDDVSLPHAFEQRIRKVVSDSDVDKNQVTSWDEFLDHIAADAQQFGRDIAGNENERRGLIKMQDRNRNGNADYEEAVNVLFRKAGFDVPFRLRGTDYYRGRKNDSRLFDAMDVDQSGGLSAQEIADSAVSLFRLDRNTDQVITWSETIASVDSDANESAWNKRRTNRNGSVATDLFGYVDWSMMAYSLDDLRGNRPFGLPDNPINQLDADANDAIESNEVKSLLNCDPDLIVTASLSAQPGTQEKLTVRWARPELTPLIQASQNESQIAINDDTLGLCISLQDRRGGENQIPLEAFSMLDANADGELDEAEIPDQLDELYSLEKLDADGNGKLTLAEINQGMMAKSPIWSVQLRGRAAEFPDVLFAYLDVDHDQSLSTREVMSAADRLAKRRRNEGELAAKDIPSLFLVQIVRGDPSQRDALFDFRPQTDLTDTETNLPRWASRMDSNSDGEISAMEFLGSAKQFDRIDTSDDGFIDVTEVQSLENSK